MEYLIVELDKNNENSGTLAFDTPEYIGSNIRLWKLGNSEQKIFPTRDAVNKLLNILDKAQEFDGITDIVWDDLIGCEVLSPNNDNISGKVGDEVFFVDVPNKIIEIDGKAYSLIHRKDVVLIRSK